MKKRIVLCADDYGQAPAISQGIVSLVKYGRLSATTCLVTSPYWLEHAKLLEPLKTLSIGLHFNLTHGEPLSTLFKQSYGDQFPRLSAILGRATMRLFNKEAITAEFEAQLDRFIEGTGSMPSFIDGHQHIHQFPVIRDIFIDLYKRRLENEAVYVRWANPRLSKGGIVNNFKKLAITSTGAGSFKRLLEANQIPHNETFSGVYPFSEAGCYRDWFIKFLQSCEDGEVIMCHPGLASNDSQDPIAHARHLEYRYLFGDEFMQDCYRYHVSLMTARSENGF